MASSKHIKPNASFLSKTDMLTNLPDILKEKILIYLPIKEAGRTSILSSKWRDAWASIPELSIGDTTYVSNPIEFVDAIFLLHNGPIRKFDICLSRDCPEALGRWIVNLSRNGIRGVTMDLYDSEDFEMPSRLFSCDELNYINLANCFLKVPSQFKGFELLDTLELASVSISDDDIEKLISTCPQLKKMRLVDLLGYYFLEIRAQNLLSLEIAIDIFNVKLFAPKLLSLSAGIRRSLTYFQHNGSILHNVPELENLELRTDFLAYLRDEPLQEEFPLVFNRLKNLSIVIDFAEEKEASFVLALLKATPHLRYFNVNVCISREDTVPIVKIWERANKKRVCFKQLQTVNIVDFRAIDAVLAFTKFILGIAPQLVTLTIKEEPVYEADDRKMFKQLLQFERASPKAKIIFE